MDLSIIIVSYNTKKLLQDCMSSIYSSQDNLDKEPIVVDNGSKDGSISMVKNKFPKVKLIETGENLGFAKANNIGVKNAKGNYVILLNSDTILETDTFQKLLDSVKNNRSQIASCKLLNSDGSIQPQGGFLPRLSNLAAWMLFIDDIPFINKLFHPYQQRQVSFFEKDRHPGWFGGTALLVKRSTYQKLGGLDENIFMYGEDVEFCMKAAKENISLDYFSSPQLTHLGQGSGSNRSAILGEFKGLKYVFSKHKPSWELPFLKLLLKIGALLRIILFGIILRDENKKTIYQEAFKLA